MKSLPSKIIFSLLSFSLAFPPHVFAQTDTNLRNSPELARLEKNLLQSLSKLEMQGAHFSFTPDFSHRSAITAKSLSEAFDASGTKSLYEIVRDPSSGLSLGIHLTLSLVKQNPTLQAEMMYLEGQRLEAFETPIATEIPINLNQGEAFKGQLLQAAQILSNKASAQLNDPFGKYSKTSSFHKAFARVTQMLIPSAHALDLGILMVPLIVAGMVLSIAFTVVWLLCKEIGTTFKNSEMSGRALIWKRNASWAFGGLIGIILLDGMISWISSPNR